MASKNLPKRTPKKPPKATGRPQTRTDDWSGRSPGKTDGR